MYNSIKLIRNSGLFSVLALGVVLLLAWPLFRWAIVDAVWSGDAGDCRAAAGACWAFIRMRFNFLLFGFYPPEEFARPVAAILINGTAIVTVICSAYVRARLSLVFGTVLVAFAASIVILSGDGVVLALVPSRLWTGFTLTVIIASGGITLGLMLGIVLAFGRNYGGLFVSTSCTAIIETLRALPSVVTMFIVVVLTPYILPTALGDSTFLRIMSGFVLVAGAFYAESVRGALLTLNKGQLEAAQSLGMKRFTSYTEIILPQVIALSFPALMNVSLMVFKDTVLVLALGYYEVLGAANASINTQEWRGFAVEMFVVVYLIFWGACSLIARAGRAVESNLYHRNR